MSVPIRICVTGAAGQINYNLLFRIANGDLFGVNQPVILHLLEVPVHAVMKALEGVAMELDDCAFPLLKNIILTDDVNKAMNGVNWALLVGSKPRGPGMERGDLIRENGPIFTSTGQAINNYASSDVRVVVVGNPCNTNCLIAMHNAPDIPKDRFSAMTRLDQNRAMTQLSKKVAVDITKIKNMIIWGNHSATQVPDYHNVTISDKKAKEVIDDLGYLQNNFTEIVAKRGAAIIEARGKSSAASAASSLIDHVRSLINPTPEGEVYSMCVSSDDNPYDIESGLIFSFPCRTKNDGNWKIVEGFNFDNFLKKNIEKTTVELISERKIISNLL